jgi:hypothetical protein
VSKMLGEVGDQVNIGRLIEAFDLEEKLRYLLQMPDATCDDLAIRVVDLLVLIRRLAPGRTVDDLLRGPQPPST